MGIAPHAKRMTWHAKPRLDRETVISAYLIWSLFVICLALFGLLAWVVV